MTNTHKQEYTSKQSTQNYCDIGRDTSTNFVKYYIFIQNGFESLHIYFRLLKSTIRKKCKWIARINLQNFFFPSEGHFERKPDRSSDTYFKIFVQQINSLLQQCKRPPIVLRFFIDRFIFISQLSPS